MSPVRPKGPVPSHLRVRMYQVGFGDCFLLSFTYPAPLPDGRAERHVLVDFGSTRLPRRAEDLAGVAKLIAQHCGGHLDVVVVTHRHKDHISGFGIQAAGAILDTLKPDLVVRPWTEDPAAPAEARGPSAVGGSSRGFASALAAGQGYASMLERALGEAAGLRGRVAEVAADQISNAEAIARLNRWAKATKGVYLHAGMASGIEGFVPGIAVRVLGPPTVEQWPAVADQRANNPEYWLAQRSLATQALAGATDAEPGAEGESTQSASGDLGPSRWLVERMGDRHLASLRRIVRSLDDALNNTSLILLIEAGNKRLLFPGDAQIENWSYALGGSTRSRQIKRLLADIDLYKVGHHGSRNATPRSLVGLWQNERSARRPLVALMSTMGGVHGETEATRVPRSSLITALERVGNLHRTDTLPPAEHFITVQAPLSSSSARLAKGDGFVLPS